MRSPLPSTFWVLEDTSSYNEREAGRRNGSAPIEIRLYRVRRGHPELIGRTSYLPGSESRTREFKVALAFELLKRAKVRKGIVVSGPRTAGGGVLLKGLAELGLDFVVALPPSAAHDSKESDKVKAGRAVLASRLARAKWNAAPFSAPHSAACYELADLGRVSYAGLRGLRCIALSTGGIADFRRGLVVGVTSLAPIVPSDVAARLLGWTRWLRFVRRRWQKQEIAAGQPATAPATRVDSAAQLVVDLTARVNLKIAKKLDHETAVGQSNGFWDSIDVRKECLAEGRQRLNVVELFAGAGGMGLGFLMGGGTETGYRLLFSGEIDPIFVNTLRVNHGFLRSRKCVKEDDVPEDTYPIDLRSPAAMEHVQAAVRDFGGVDVVIGGPPCQGFSSANRNSWSSRNPNNKLVDTYLDYVVRLRPRVLIMENVQGILWTPKHDAIDRLSVAGHVAERLASAGYRIFPKLLDAAWYGVPQHRNRFFLLGIHSDLGYAQDEFGEWGPFPRPTHGPLASRPYVTVRDAIADLPPIGNGADSEELPYRTAKAAGDSFLSQMRRWAPSGAIWDHVTSRHADYVIERYKKIPSGGNWSSITDMMTNYADVGRTHSNIYRRLAWDEPSITIGHYRKAMLVHPEQDRGLSLREASRLQSFPDWFRFAGGTERVEGGLTYKQQQLGNAVCPLVTKAVAEYLLKL